MGKTIQPTTRKKPTMYKKQFSSNGVIQDNKLMRHNLLTVDVKQLEPNIFYICGHCRPQQKCGDHQSTMGQRTLQGRKQKRRGRRLLREAVNRHGVESEVDGEHRGGQRDDGEAGGGPGQGRAPVPIPSERREASGGQLCCSRGG